MFFVLALLFSIHAQATDGNIAVWYQGKPVALKVTLPTMTTELKNDLVSFTNLPDTLKPDETGCYCYQVDQTEFAFVHAFYYSTQWLEKINQALTDLGMSIILNTKISLQQMLGAQPGGITDIDKRRVSLHYQSPAFDLSILAHEIGHVAHLSQLGSPLTDFVNAPVDPTSVTLEDLKKFNFQMGIVEGNGQLSSVLLTGDSRVGRYDWFDASDEMDNFVRFPDLVPTAKDEYTKWATQPIFTKACPKTAEFAKNVLSNQYGFPHFEESMKWPYPYTAAAAIIQPLIRAIHFYGSDTVLKIQLRSMKNLRKWSGYKDWAESILNETEDPVLKQYLIQEYSIRGLFTESANP